MKADETSLAEGAKKGSKTVAEFLKSLPSEGEVRKMLEVNTDERKQLRKLLKIVEDNS